MRAGVLAGIVAAFAVTAGVAQEAVPNTAILVLRQEAFFDGSAFGKASRDRIETASRALAAENREIEAGLEAEERDLTARRATLPAAEFRTLSEAFNEKVEGIRAAQETKSRAIARTRDEDRQRFLQAALPVLAEIMQEQGASVILDQQAVILNFERVDVTDIAITRIDAAVGTGDGPRVPQSPNPQTEGPALPPVVAPEPAPTPEPPTAP